MSQHLPALKPAKVLRAIERAGFYVHHVKGSHYFLKHPGKPQARVTLPFHGTDLKRRTLASIIDQAGLSVETFLELLQFSGGPPMLGTFLAGRRKLSRGFICAVPS